MTTLENGGWNDVREFVHGLPKRLPVTTEPLHTSLGRILAADVPALTDVPNVDASAMDGWAVSGPGPWRLAGAVVTGQPSGMRLGPAEAVVIATGGCVPLGAERVLRHEHGTESEGTVSVAKDGRLPAEGANIRSRGEEFATGEVLLTAGQRLNPVSLAVAASAGHDELPVSARPSADLIVTGNEVDVEGIPTWGRVRDSFTPMFDGLCMSAGMDPGARQRAGDDEQSLVEAMRSCTAPIIVTTGGTAGSGGDTVRAALDTMRASIVVDRIDVRPGRPSMLARLPGGRFVVALPGNPLAALVGWLAVVEPLAAGMTGAGLTPMHTIELDAGLDGDDRSTRAVPYSRVGRHSGDDPCSGSVSCPVSEVRAAPSPWHRASMLRGMVDSDGLLVAAPGAGARGDTVDAIGVSWRC